MKGFIRYQLEREDVAVMKDFYIIQRFDGKKWVDYSCHYFYSPIGKVLRQYMYFKEKHSTERLRIARGKEDIGAFFSLAAQVGG